MVDVVSIISDGIVGIAAIITVFLAFVGLNTWKQQMKGGKSFEIAQKIMNSVYRIKYDFNAVRNPAIMQHEYPDELTNSEGVMKGHLKDEHIYEGNAHVYRERLRPLMNDIVLLEEHVINAAVIWGSGYLEIIIPLRKCLAKLRMAIQDHLELKREPSLTEEALGRKRGDIKKIIYNVDGNPQYDTLTCKINEAISFFEDSNRRVLDKTEIMPLFTAEMKEKIKNFIV